MLEFKRMCEKLAPMTFVFDSQNQKQLSRVFISEQYTDINFMFNPNCISFKNEHGILCFDGVKQITYRDDLKHTSKVFGIVCGNLKDSDSDETYIILGNKNL